MTVNEKPPAPLIVDETAFSEAVVHALETARAELAACQQRCEIAERSARQWEETAHIRAVNTRYWSERANTAIDSLTAEQQAHAECRKAVGELHTNHLIEAQDYRDRITELEGDRDELRAECARLREALLMERQRSSAYVETNANQG